MATAAKANWTEGAVAQHIRTKYAPPKWACFFGVPNSTGYASSRRADGIAMGLWPSAGLHLHGFEIKVSRSDWLREIQDPTKAHAIGKFCHFWWIVAPADVVKVEEMPEGWGLQVVSESGLRVKKGLEPRTAEPITLNFLAAILRKAQESSPAENEIKAAHDKGFSEARRGVELEIQMAVKRSNNDLALLQASVKQFEDASGIKIENYNGHRLGETVRAIDNSGAKRLPPRLLTVSGQLEEMAKSCKIAAEILSECFESNK